MDRHKRREIAQVARDYLRQVSTNVPVEVRYCKRIL